MHFVLGAVLAAACRFGLKPTTPRWQGFARVLTFLALLAPLMGGGLDEGRGAVIGTLNFFVWAAVLTTVLLGPAIAIWPRPGKGTGLALVSMFLGVFWYAAVHVALIAPAVWDEWGLCLPPARLYPGRSGPYGKAPDECVVYDP